MNEKRIYRINGLEAREATADEPAIIRGYAAVFNSRSVDLGGFVEIIKPGAFGRSLINDPDVRATIDHEGGLTTLGRTRNNTLRLWEDEQGLGVQIIPPDTQAGRDVVTLVRRGDVDQMSFMFRVPEGGDEWRSDDGQMIRTLREVDINDGDVSIVTYPAYPQTSVEARAKVKELANIPGPDEAGNNGNEAGGPGLQVRAARRRLELIKRK